MIHLRSILVLYLMFGVALVAADQAETPKKEAPKQEKKSPVTEPRKAATPVAAPIRARRPIRSPASTRSEYAKPHVEAVSHKPQVVWDRSWDNPVTVQWEDAPPRKTPVIEVKESTPNMAEELSAIKKNLEELTQMVRTLAAQQARQ
jgi:hypothetical protein